MLLLFFFALACASSGMELLGSHFPNVVFKDQAAYDAWAQQHGGTSLDARSERGVTTSCAAAPFGPTLLDFELVSPPDSVCRTFEPIGTYGQSQGVCFPPEAIFLTSGQVSSCLTSNTASMTSGNTAVFFLDSSEIIVDVAGGFSNGFTFSHANPGESGTLDIFDAPGATGNILASRTIGTTPNGKLIPGCYGKNFCPYIPESLSFLGRAYSVRFSGAANNFAFDDFNFGAEPTPRNVQGPFCKYNDWLASSGYSCSPSETKVVKTWSYCGAGSDVTRYGARWESVHASGQTTPLGSATFSVFPDSLQCSESCNVTFPHCTTIG